MPDHMIRLRGGWELTDGQADRRRRAEASGDLPVRLSLPVAWPGGSARRVRLVRKFGRPAHDPAHESLAARRWIVCRDCEASGSTGCG